MRRAIEIFLALKRHTGHEHPHLRLAFDNYSSLLKAMGWSETEIAAMFAEMGAPSE
jgi:hypothetical protein